MPARRRAWSAILKAALRRRCPACREGRIFASFLRLRRSCPSCHWVVEREPGAVTGAMYLISIVSQLFAVLLLVLLWLLTDWSPVIKIAVAVPTIVVFSLVALPLTKSLWVAVEYATDVAAGETGREDYERRAYDATPSEPERSP